MLFACLLAGLATGSVHGAYDPSLIVATLESEQMGRPALYSVCWPQPCCPVHPPPAHTCTGAAAALLAAHRLPHPQRPVPPFGFLNRHARRRLCPAGPADPQAGVCAAGNLSGCVRNRWLPRRENWMLHLCMLSRDVTGMCSLQATAQQCRQTHTGTLPHHAALLSPQLNSLNCFPDILATLCKASPEQEAQVQALNPILAGAAERCANYKAPPSITCPDGRILSTVSGSGPAAAGVGGAGTPAAEAPMPELGAMPPPADTMMSPGPSRPGTLPGIGASPAP